MNLISNITSKNIYELTFLKVNKRDEKLRDEKPRGYSSKYGVLAKFGGLKDLLNAANKAISTW